jgi:hypothetical protein
MIIKILFLAADPSNATRLRLGEEVRDVKEILQLSKRREEFLLNSRESVRPRDITQAIHDIEPQIVHFSGHGSNTGELYFEDATGKAQSIKPDALADLFEIISDQVSCVILNACYSEPQAKAISKHIPCVIGMSQAIGDKSAIAFAAGFYKALGAGRSFEDAYKFGKVEIKLQGIQNNSIPVLYVKENKNTLVPQAENILISELPSLLAPKTSDNFDRDGEEITLFPSSETITLEEALQRFEISPIIKRYGTWAVTTYGVECLSNKYYFEMDRVDEPDWVDHMRKKRWPIMPDFEAALSYAREFKKMKQIYEAVVTEALPKPVLLGILASRKKILFIEGDEGGLDYKIYKAIYPKFLIIPCNGCEKVIAATKAMRDNPAFHHVEAFGIIDMDYRPQNQIDSLKASNIFVLNVAGIENIFCVPELLEIVATYLIFDNSSHICQEIEDVVINKLEEDLQNQVAKRSASEIQFKLNRFNAKQSKEKTSLVKNFEDLVASINVNDIYENNLNLYKNIISVKDYKKALLVYNQKNLHSMISSFFGLKYDGYVKLILRLLFGERKDDIVSVLKKYTPTLL